MAKPAPRKAPPPKKKVPPAPVVVRHGLLTVGRPHWAFRTEGLAQELTLRVVKRKEDFDAPAWGTALLTSLVARIQRGELRPAEHFVLQLTEPLAPGVATELSALLFSPIDTGWLVVAITRDEAQLVREWSPAGLLEVLGKLDPRLMTDLDRPSLLQTPRARAVIEQRVAQEGSSLSSMSATSSQMTMAGKAITWRLSADAIETFIALLKGRIGHLRSFSVISDEQQVEVMSADRPGVEVTPKRATLKLSLVAARQLRATLRAVPGRYVFDALPGFTLLVM